MTSDIRAFFTSSAPKKTIINTKKSNHSSNQTEKENEIIRESAFKKLKTQDEPLNSDLENDAIVTIPENSDEKQSIVIQDSWVKTMEDNIHVSWKTVLEKEFSMPYFRRLKKFLSQEYLKKDPIYPPREEIFAALNHCPFDSLKVVIIGQDPYHGPHQVSFNKQAHGLCFSVVKGVSIPPSLKNIFKEVFNDVGISIPSHGCLTSWSDQGILLLNTVLTVKAHCANSHKNQGWEIFTDRIIQSINEKLNGIVFLLWGKPAQEKCKYINLKKHFIIKSSHPSPLGASKTNSPFLGSQCFSKTNKILKELGKSTIDWNIEKQ